MTNDDNIVVVMPASTSQGDPQFHTTHWSLVVAAAGEPGEASQMALADLCQAYWYPVYAFIRRRGHTAEDARDLAQEFFATLLEKGYLADADPDRGRFRAFLLTAVARFVSKQHERAAAQKRGGGRQTLSLNFEEGESRYQHEPSHDWTPERIFDRRWALTLCSTARSASFARSTKRPASCAQFDVLKVFLTGEAGAPPLRQVAEKLAMTEGAVKVAIHRLRQKYREALRAQIAQTVATQEMWITSWRFF